MNDRPWMTALEMQFAALRQTHLIQSSYKSDTEWMLRHADTFAWSADTTSAVSLAMKSVPATSSLSSALLGSGCGWWWLDRPLHINPTRPTVALLYGCLIGAPEHTNDVLIRSFEMSGGDVVPGFVITWPLGASIKSVMDATVMNYTGDHYDETKHFSTLADHAGTTARFLLAGLVWLHQRVVVMSSGHVERHRRKQLAREHNAPLPSDVKVIQLRRAESQSRPPSAGGESVEWSCRWIVNGHWRNQPYKDERKLIYIMPYVKGPDDMPLKVPTHTVYQVSR